MQRVAQREVRREMAQPKKQQSQQRRDIAALKRQIGELERRVAYLDAQEAKRLEAQQSPADAVMAALAQQSSSWGSKSSGRPARRSTSARASGGSGSRGKGRSASRFQPRGLRTHRNKLGFSAAEYGQLVGVSGQTIYAWENEKSRPRQKQTEALAEVRKLGKRQARARIGNAPTQNAGNDSNNGEASTSGSTTTDSAS